MNSQTSVHVVFMAIRYSLFARTSPNSRIFEKIVLANIFELNIFKYGDISTIFCVTLVQVFWVFFSGEGGGGAVAQW